MPAVVQRPHHGLELLDLLAQLSGRRVLVVRGEEPDRVVAPVVAQALVEQGRVLHELVHGHQLDRGDPEVLEVLDDERMRDARVGAALALGDARVEFGEALDVRLVDDRVLVRRLRLPVARPVEERVHHDREHHVLGRVAVVRRVGVAELVREERLIPVELARGRLRVRVEQHLVGVAAQTVLGVVRPRDAVAVPLARLDLRQVRVPHVRVDVAQGDALFGAVLGEQAQLDLLGHFGEQREVRAAPVERRAERIGAAWPDLQWVSSEVGGKER